MKPSKIGRIVAVLVRPVAIALLALTMNAWLTTTAFSDQLGAASTKGERVSIKFDLGKCQQLSPYLYQCPAVDKPICTPEYTKNDVICVKVDKNGVLIQQLT